MKGTNTPITRPSNGRTRRLVWTAAVAAILGVACWIVEARTLTGGGGFAETVPARETALNHLLPAIGVADLLPRVLTDGGNRICVLALEGKTLRAVRSGDGGATFIDTAVVGEYESPILDFDAVVTSAGTVFVVAIRGGADGLFRAWFLRSDDMGQSWSAPILVTPDVAATQAQVEAGVGGVVVIAAGAYVTVSTDSGDTWGPAVNSGIGSSQTDLAIGTPANTIHLVATAQEATRAVRSVDLGASFEPQVPMPAPSVHRWASIAAAVDGVILVAFSVEAPGSGYQTTICRSTDNGQTYERVLSHNFYFEMDGHPRLVTHPGSAVVLLGHVDDLGNAYVFRSIDHGESFGDPLTLASSAHMSFRDDLQFVRTPAGAWVSAWRDRRATAEGDIRAIYARSSVDGGATWGPERRVHSEAAVITSGPAFGIGASGINDIVVGFVDGRDEPNGHDNDIYLSRGSAATLNLQPEVKIDIDAAVTGPYSGLHFPAIAGDGSLYLYAAFVARDSLRDYGLYVTVSADRGRSFATPQRIGDAPLASFATTRLIVRATPDGFAYVYYIDRSPPSGEQIRLAFSTDYGQTWDNQIVPGSLNVPDSSLALATAPGGRLFAAFSPNNQSIRVLRSTDGGLTLNGDSVGFPTGLHLYPELCAAGGRLFLVFYHQGLAYAAVSDDGAESFGEPQAISTSPPFVRRPMLDCTDSGDAVVVWETTDRTLLSARYSGSTWQPPVLISTGSADLTPTIRYTGADDQQLLVVADSGADSILAFASTDGGATFNALPDLDAAAVNPAAQSRGAELATDRRGNVWVIWEEDETGREASIVFRHSSDGGLSFGALRRLDRTPVRGLYAQYSPVACALPDGAFFAYVGSRRTAFTDVLFNSHDLLDLDRDGSPGDEDCDEANPDAFPGAPQICDGVDNTCGGLLPANESDPDNDGSITCDDNCPATSNPTQADLDEDALGDSCDNCPASPNPGQGDTDLDGTGDSCDCAPSDSSSFALPPEVPAARTTARSIEWESVAGDAGAGTTYELIRGDLAELPSGAGPTESCAFVGSTTMYDHRGDTPIEGQGYFYLIRGANGCGTGSLGAVSSGQERIGVDCP